MFSGMNCSTNSPNFTSVLCSPEYKENIQEYERAAEKALVNISLIYNEIMTPKEYESKDTNIDSIYEEGNISHSYIMQNHCIRTCCSSVKELCVKCDRFISRCASCNQCKFCTSNKNLNVILCKETSHDYQPSNKQHLELKYTVPKPFSFDAKIEEYQKAKEHKIVKIKQNLEKELENELKVRANRKSVPKTTHLPLYNQMIQEMELRKVKRKEKSQSVLNDAKPFHLHSTIKNSEKAKSTTDLTSENTHFRAKPIPRHILSNKISEKLKNKEEIRKQLINERAKQIVENSSLPFSQKAVPCTRSCVDLYSLNKAQNKEESKPKKISEITKRLYVKKCSAAMENWNKKVMEVNVDQKKFSLNECVPFNAKQLTKKEALPFMFFPVRMSNASLLREKQIREEITARKGKVKDEEVIKKRFNSDILHKLKNLIPPSEREKEIEEKVKNFRVFQIERQQAYEKELEEILKKVSDQNLLLERQSKVNEMNLNKSSDKENVLDASGTLESVGSYSDTESFES